MKPNYNKSIYRIIVVILATFTVIHANSITKFSLNNIGVVNEEDDLFNFCNKKNNIVLAPIVENEKDSDKGLNRVHLPQKIVDGKNVLTQDMLVRSNTTFIIKHDYNLNGSVITIPEDCVIDFEKGSFSNGTIIGNNTSINATIAHVFKNINLKGTWCVDNAYPEWFGAKGDGVIDDTIPVQVAVSCSSKTILSRNYLITNKIVLHGNSFINGKGSASIIVKNGVNILKALGTNGEEECSNIRIEGVNFIGFCDNDIDDESGLVAIELLKTNSIQICGCSFTGFNKNIELTSCEEFLIFNNKLNNAYKTRNQINGYGILLEATKKGVIDNNIMNNIIVLYIYHNITL